jgi:FG-GAP-like repeat
MLYSNFQGPFTAGGTYPTGYDPTSVVATYFHGGDVLDLAVANSGDNTITILYNGGSGIAFYPGPTISLPGKYPSQLVAGDFNADGHMDLAVVNTCGTGASGCLPTAVPQEPGTVTVLLGDGFDGFTVSQAALPVGMIPYSLVQGDFNNDGILDLAVANSGDNTVSILIGNGDGTFTPTTASPRTGNGPLFIATGDFNQDGNLDLAVTNSTDGTVSLLLNQNCASVAPSACTFAPTPVSPGVGAQPAGIAVGDMNADGFLDLVVANSAGHSLSILLGDGTGSFQAVSPDFFIDTQAQPQSVALGDFNQDGRLDVAFTDSAGTFRVLRQAGVTQVTLTSSNPCRITGSS